MNNFLKSKINLSWSLTIALVAAMIFYMTYMEIIFSIGLVTLIGIIIPVILLLTLQKLKIIPPDRDSAARFISSFGYIFGSIAYFLVFYIHLSFYQTLISLIIGLALSGVYFLLKKVFTDNENK